MKNGLIKWVLLFYFFIGHSQSEGNIWYFGVHAGLDFSNGTPVALTNGRTDTNEGTATLSNSSGQLLFYTDGVTVWDKNHYEMPNGVGLMGNFSSTQSSIILPKPDSNTIYYIFTVSNNAKPDGLRYSEVDMSLNGGLGDVNSTKNVPLHTPSCEKIAAIKKASGDGYWVVTHFYGTNEFYTYSVSASGVNTTPVVNGVGTIVTANNSNNTLGYLKFSSDGTRLICANGDINAELFDFNTTTGVISNPRVLYTGTNYGAEFSPSGNLLYLTTEDKDFFILKLWQFDLTVPNIISSQKLIYNSNPNDQIGALQLAANGKIYLALNFKHTLGVINNPDNVGFSCDFQIDGVDLITGVCVSGLPQFMQSYFETSFSVQNLCMGYETQFNFNKNVSNITSALWNFGDGIFSSDINAKHQYTVPGNYTVTVKAISPLGSSTKSKTITITETPIVPDVFPNQTICGATSMAVDLSQFTNLLLGKLSPSVFGVAYFSNMDDVVNHTNILKASYILPANGTLIYAKIYNLVNANCYTIKTFEIAIITQEVNANAPVSQFLCDNSSNEGIGTFNLQTKTEEILGIQNASNFSVSYYSSQNDANTNNNPLPQSYQNTKNPQTIFARVQNKQYPNCYATTSFQIGLYKLPIANQPQNLTTCDDDSNDGKENFNLANQSKVVLGNQTENDFIISYHKSQTDANSGINQLPNNYTNSNSSQIIYVRIANTLSAACFATTSFQLNVKKKPELNMKDDYSICEGESIKIVAPNGFSSYSWSNGSTIPSTVISKAGDYSVTVTKNYGDIICESTKAIVVSNSNIATITKIETQDWSDSENNITVYVTGEGNYEYSIDGVNYQDSSQFFGLNNGQYKIYVKDKKGCGIKTDEVFLLIYPKFFTPNGDGYNDSWHIKYSNSEPKMKLTIYDRYGKIINSYNGLNSGWDGKLNGELLPSDDYWFVVQRESGKEYRGHFAMKR